MGTQRQTQVFGYVAREVSNGDAEAALNGMVAGLQTNKTTSAFDTNTNAIMSGLTALGKDNMPLYVVDGSVAVQDSMPNITPDEISNIEVIKAEHAKALYGNAASEGLVVITTKKGLATKGKAINPNTPYITILEKEETVEQAYCKYLEIRNEFANSPSFYIDVSDFFDQQGNRDLAIRTLTNLSEIELNNHELLKALAYKLEYYKQYDLAVKIYQKVLELRPEEPQSYRDLALAYEKSGAIKKSYDLLYQIYNGGLLEKDMGGRFNGIEQIAFVELNRLVHKYEKELGLKPAQKEKFSHIPVDVRVLIDWNHNDTDIDLWVTDPTGEKANYQNTRTKLGGRMSQDVTQGYGPEEYMLKKAKEGAYEVVVNYFADNVQKISGPTFLKVTLFTNYAKENEVSKTIIVRLDTRKGKIEWYKSV